MENRKTTKFTRIVARLTCFVVLLFSCPLFVHAEDTTPLPYAPGMIEGYTLTSQELTSLQSLINEINGGVDLSSDNVIIFKSQETLWWTWSEMATVPFYTIYQLDNTEYLSSSFSTAKTFLTFDLFDEYCSIDVTMPTGKKFVFYPRGGIGNLSNGNWSGEQLSSPGGSVVRFYGALTPTTVSTNYFNFTWYQYYPIYCNGSFTTIDRDSFPGIFLTSNLQEVPVDPTPTDPEDPDPITPDIPSPVWPEFPNSPTVENLLEWIGNCVKAIGNWLNGFGSWLKVALNKIITNIVNGFVSVIDNFKSLFKPFIDKALAFYDEITSTIQNGITDLISLITDIKTALENVKKFFDYIVSIGTENGQFTLTTLFVNLFIPSSADINQAFIDTDSFALITFFKTAFNKVSTIWDSIVNASVKKSIHVNGFVFHGVTIPGFDIDFSWFDNIKSYSDVIISAFLIINYIWFIFFRAPSFIRGHSNMAGAVGGVIDNHDSKGNVT